MTSTICQSPPLILRRHDHLAMGLDAKSTETSFRVAQHLQRRITHMGDHSAATVRRMRR